MKVDLGCGSMPAWDCDVLVDLEFKCTPGEHQQFRRMDAVEFLKQQKDKSIEFINCRALLEHLDNPGECIREMERTALCGYIELPNKWFDMWLRNRNHVGGHKWYCEYKDNSFRLTPRSSWIPLIPAVFVPSFRKLCFLMGIRDSYWIFWEDKIPIRCVKEK